MPTLLVLSPHPDDEAYAFAGLMAACVREGWRVQVHCASSGEKGKRHDGGPTDVASVAAAREAELVASCAHLGAAPPAFWRLPDGCLRDHHQALLERVAVALDSALAAQGPRLAVAMLGPDGAYGHPDHLALRDAVTRSPLVGQCKLVEASFPKGLFVPQYERCLHMMGDPPFPPRIAIGSLTFSWALDVRADRELKLAAIAAHRSQLPGGDPRALFPSGIVDALLDEERYDGPRLI